MFTFRTWTVSQCAALPEIHNFVFDWEAEAHIHHLVVAFLTWWFCMVHLLLSLRNPDWSKFTLLRQMINCERGIELERIIGNHTSLLVFTERWRMKCLFYYICQYGSVAIIFSTLPVSLIFLIPSHHTPWHVNVTVDPVGKPCDVLIEISLYVNAFTPVILS